MQRPFVPLIVRFKSVALEAGRRAFQWRDSPAHGFREGYELILGSSIDAQFGPVLLFGTGGQLVEVFQDRALALPPLNTTLARRFIEQTRIFTALKGVRGRKPVDIEALERLLVRFSQLVLEQNWIREIDINPLLASSETLLALDARVVLYPQGTNLSEIPKPAIRPYPSKYAGQVGLKDGTVLHIRPIRPEDEPEFVRFHATLSEQSFPFLAQKVKTQNSSNGEFESWGYRAGSSRKSSRLPRCGS